MLLRLFSFRPDRAGDSADELLRQQLLPSIQRLPGLRHLYAARASAADDDRRVVASVWDEAAGASRALLSGPLPFETTEHVLEVEVELHRLDLAIDFETGGPPQILRIFRGLTNPGALDAYVEEARQGTFADALADHGPEALFLARVPPDAFVTVSAWSGWERIAASTGGNLRQPIATRHAHMLAGGTAWFYEIVPSTPFGRVGPSGPPEPTLAMSDVPAVAPGS